MKTQAFPRIMIAGTGSGCGKTTITCGLLKALVNRGTRTAAFKCGPDYIDPMFHTEVTGTKARNLDTFLCGENSVKYLLASNCRDVDIAVIEGVMGYYDGLGSDGSHSSYAISRLTGTPVIIVLKPEGMALSVAAIVKGFADFLPGSNIKGVIINSVSQSLYPMYKQMIEENTGIKVYGYLPEVPEAVIESRHLGLVTAGEISDLQRKLQILADNFEKYVDIEGILRLAESAAEVVYEPPFKVLQKYNCNIAVAKDRAFCFYYEDALRLLEQMGATLKYFSPLNDTGLPSDIDGLVLGGGYPELYARQLSENKSMLDNIKKVVEKGLPTYAECGGFMYLQQTITVSGSKTFPMVSAVEGNSMMQKHLSRFGYVTLTAGEDNLFCSRGGKIAAHEFHFSDSDKNGNSFYAECPGGGTGWECIFAGKSLFAGYPHIHFYGNPGFAEKFVQKCCEYRKGNLGQANR
ncbi:MAG TPA: cobyrinate a,c-diamide synthase [Ruminiclostridium sp.]|nr:cobyrinate a,c-diamide synthase [Ruminiclostridium sp.]